MSPPLAGPTGRPPHEPTKKTRDAVRLLSGSGVDQDRIAAHLEIAPKTLRLHYRRELDLALVELQAGWFGSLHQKAMSPTHPSAAIAAMFLLKTRAGYSERLALVGGGKDDPPVRVAHDVDLSALNRDQLMALLTLADAVPATPDETDDADLVDL